MKPRAGSAAAALSLLLFAPACGSSGNGGSEASARSFVHQVCTDIASTLHQAQSKQTTFQTKVQGDASKGLGAVKSDTVAYLGEAIGLFQSMHDKLAQITAPDLEDARQGKAKLVSGVGTVLVQLRRLKTDVGQASTKSPTAFAQHLQGDVTQLQRVSSGLGQGLDNLKSPKLDAAFKADPACKSLQSASAGGSSSG